RLVALACGRSSGYYVLPYHLLDCVLGIARCLLRDGVLRRRLRPQFAVESVRADRDLLSDQHSVRADRSWFDRTDLGLLDHSLHPLYQVSTADRCPNLVIGTRSSSFG